MQYDERSPAEQHLVPCGVAAAARAAELREDADKLERLAEERVEISDELGHKADEAFAAGFEDLARIALRLRDDVDCEVAELRLTASQMRAQAEALNAGSYERDELEGFARRVERARVRSTQRQTEWSFVGVSLTRAARRPGPIPVARSGLRSGRPAVRARRSTRRRTATRAGPDDSDPEPAGPPPQPRRRPTAGAAS